MGTCHIPYHLSLYVFVVQFLVSATSSFSLVLVASCCYHFLLSSSKESVHLYHALNTMINTTASASAFNFRSILACRRAVLFFLFLLLIVLLAFPCLQVLLTQE